MSCRHRASAATKLRCQFKVAGRAGACPDGKELFFLSGGNLDLMAADVRVEGDALFVGVPKLLFQTQLKSVVLGWPYDVARDGRFLMNVRADAEIAPPAMVVSNWPALISKN